jgi:predicted RNase H-like nuclease
MKFKTPTLTDKLEEKNREIQNLKTENEALKKQIEELNENLSFQKFKYDEQSKEVKKEQGKNKSIQDSAKRQNIVMEQFKVSL